MLKTIVCALPCLFLPALASADVAECLQNAQTRAEMDRCAVVVEYFEADAELNRVYQEIRRQYADNPLFLKKLRAAQQAWIRLRDADLEMTYPGEDKDKEYGLVFRTCASTLLTDRTLDRVEYLKQWLRGVDDVDVCGGSIHRR